jgi:hypothetical protein
VSVTLDDELLPPMLPPILPEDELEPAALDELETTELEELLEAFFGVNWTSILS